ncbi:MAG: MBL fold metallo-hydrolase [Candidatus Hodarchaeales archaeon]
MIIQLLLFYKNDLIYHLQVKILNLPSPEIKKLSESLIECVDQSIEGKTENAVQNLSTHDKFELYWLISHSKCVKHDLFKKENLLWSSIRSIFNSEYTHTDQLVDQHERVLTFVLVGVFLDYLDLEDFRSVVRFLYTHSLAPETAITEINDKIVDLISFFTNDEDPVEKFVSMVRFIGIPPAGFDDAIQKLIAEFPKQKRELEDIKELPINTCQNYPEYIPEMVEKLDYDRTVPVLKQWIDHTALNSITEQIVTQFTDKWIPAKYEQNEDFFKDLIDKRKEKQIVTIPVSHGAFVKPYINKLKASTVHASTLPKTVPAELLPGYLERLAYPILTKEKVLEINFLGGAQIGTMGILISTSQSTILIDYGLSVANYQLPYWHEALPNIDAIFLTHAHLDHSGAVPYLFSQGYSGYVFGSPMTKQLSSFLLADSQKLMQQNFSEPINRSDYRFKELSQESYLYQMMERFIPIKSGEEYQITPDIMVKPFNAHHIQGSYAYQIDSGSKKVLFTGDINFDPCALFREKIPEIPKDSDLSIVDSTYYGQPGVDSSARDKLLFQTIKESNRVIIPAFSVGRAQEILLKLENEGITKNYKVSLLGMASKVARISGIKTKAHLSSRLVQPFDNEIVIAGGGMLNGGHARKLVEDTKDDPDTAVILCGYLAQNTLAYRLLHGLESRYKQKIVYTRFSAHSSGTTLNKFLSSVKGKKALVHLGELTKDPITVAKEKKREQYDLGKIHIPHLGSKIRI